MSVGLGGCLDFRPDREARVLCGKVDSKGGEEGYIVYRDEQCIYIYIYDGAEIHSSFAWYLRFRCIGIWLLDWFGI